MNDLKEKRKATLVKIRENTLLKKHFFKKLSVTSNPFPWIEDLIDEGYFNPENYPSPQEVPDNEGFYTMPFWEPLGYLENLAKLNYQDKDEKTTELLVKIVNDYVNYNYEERNYRTDHIFLKIIFYLPKNEITKDHINLISKALNSKWDSTLIQSEISETVIKRLIEYQLKDLLINVLEIILDYKDEADEYYNDYVSIMDEFWFNNTLKENKPIIAQFSALDASKVALKKISDIVNIDESQFNYVSIPAIEDHPQTLIKDRYEVQLVYFIRDMFEYLHSEHIYPEELRECAEKLALSKKKIFERISIYLINLYYNELNDIFWDWSHNPLDDVNLRHDIYRFFKLNHEKFSNDDGKINLIIEWIDTQKYICKLENEGKEPRIIALQKLKILDALKESQNQKIQSLIKKYKELYSDEIEHPDFGIWHTELKAVTPKESEKLCKKSNNELAEYLNSKSTSESFFDISDLSESFIKCVSDNPEKFTTDLNPFLNVSKRDQHDLIYGLLSAWRSERTFGCNEIFDFILEILEDKNFWEEDYAEETNYRNWIISAVADFIEIGTKDDRYAFNNELLPEAEKILLILAKNTKAELPEMHDLVTSVLNSPLGKIFSAMIVYSLKIFRETEKFPEEIRLEFEDQLKAPPTELLVTIGRFLPNLCAIDRNWVKNNINLIFSINNRIWEAAFIGYLFYSSVIYTDIYNLLKKEGCYEKAIEADFDDRNINQRLIQHICTFYLENKEDLNDPNSLISKLINHKNPKQISFIIHFISSRKELISIDQVKSLWAKIIEIFSENEVTENCEIIAKLYRWLKLAEEIDDDIYNWLIISAKCMKSQSSMSIFIENLKKHVQKTPEKVGKIFLELLEKTPEHRKEDIINIVEVLFQKEETEIANYICNEYRIKGLDFLRDIHEKYNK